MEDIFSKGKAAERQPEQEIGRTQTSDHAEGLRADALLDKSLVSRASFQKPDSTQVASLDLSTPVLKEQPQVMKDSQPDAQQAANLIMSAITIGARQYQAAFGDNGQLGSISFGAPDSSNYLELRRDANGQLMLSRSAGDFQNSNGVVNFEGIPVQVNADGQVVGDLSVNSKGELIYKVGTGDDRIEYCRKTDGTLVNVDAKNWKRTEVSPDGRVSEKFWDGFEWRQGQMAADGNRIDFVPKDPQKPDYVQRNNGESGFNFVRYADGHTFQCDWPHRLMKETIPGSPPQERTMYYNGALYMEATQVTQNPNGDTTIVFKDPASIDPKTTIYKADGSMTTIMGDNTTVEKDPWGFVNSISGPRGNWQFVRDVNGDVMQANHVYLDADGKQQNKVFKRKGADPNAGMERWFSRQSVKQPRPMDELPPPRDPENPQNYAEFVNESGQTVKMNLNVTADGTVRTEYPGLDFTRGYVTYEYPGQDATTNNVVWKKRTVAA
jgi:hypothetical protein